MTIYEEYTLLESKIKELETTKDKLRENILEDMLENGGEPVKTPLGKFTLAKRRVWTYPEAVLEINEKFKTAKAKSESNGTATCIEVDSLKYISLKL